VEKVEVHSTSNQSAVGSDIVIRETDHVRLVFRPELVDNPHDPPPLLSGVSFIDEKPRKTSGNRLKQGERNGQAVRTKRPETDYQEIVTSPSPARTPCE
jgi:hypothetical protein